MKRLIFYGALLLILVTAIITMRPYLFSSDEKRIKKVISQAEKAVEKKNLPQMMKCLSPRYTDDFGHNYATLQRNLKQLFEYTGPIKVAVDYLDIEVDIEKRSAIAYFLAKVTSRVAGQKIDLVKEFCGSDRFVARLQKINGQWKIRSVKTLEYTFD